MGYSPWGCKELDTTEGLSIVQQFLRSIYIYIVNAYLSFKNQLNCLLFQEVFQPYPRSHTLASLAIPHPLSMPPITLSGFFFLFSCWTVRSLRARAICIPC